MQRIWSPWRSQHLDTFQTARADEGAGSVFSRLAAEQDDEQNLILCRSTYVFVIMNLYPYNNGHLMIVPYREIADFDALTRAEQTDLTATLDRCLRWLRHALAPEGFNVGMNLGAAAGAGIPGHLHLHVVPRWNGDTNFMPTIGEVKVIPQALRDTYERLRAAIQEIGDPPPEQ